MKIKGQEVKGRNRDFILIPRGGGDQDIVLWVEAIPNYDEFNKLCPFPQAPQRKLASGKIVYDREDKDYLKELGTYSLRQTAYIMLKSLDQPENELEWDTVKMDKPSTWANIEEEIKAAGFSNGEFKHILDKCWEVNAMSEAKIEEARQAFAHRLEVEGADTSGPSSEQDSTKSGEPANAGK
jgi:hypothetical protein